MPPWRQDGPRFDGVLGDLNLCLQACPSAPPHEPNANAIRYIAGSPGLKTGRLNLPKGPGVMHFRESKVADASAKDFRTVWDASALVVESCS